MKKIVKLIKKNLAIFYILLFIIGLVAIKKLPTFFRSIKYNLTNTPLKNINKNEEVLFKNFPNGIETDTVLAHNAFYQIYYIKNDNLFLISIISSPFQEVVSVAEQDFLDILGVSESNACKLKVNITTPRFANPKEAGTMYKLSFCNK